VLGNQAEERKKRKEKKRKEKKRKEKKRKEKKRKRKESDTISGGESTSGRETKGEVANAKDAARLQISAQWWEQLLHATGGQLELPKCFYYLLHWVFDYESCARLATPDEMDIQISIQQSADDQEIDIAQRCC
jgi:hypothetical protein